MNKLVMFLIGVIVVLIGLVLFLLFPPTFKKPPVTQYTYNELTKSEFIAETEKNNITIEQIETSTEAFYVLASKKTVSVSTVFENAKFQIGFQYVESAEEHQEIFIYFDEEIERYYYYSPAEEGHDKHLIGYIDYNTDHFHIGHIK